MNKTNTAEYNNDIGKDGLLGLVIAYADYDRELHINTNEKISFPALSPEIDNLVTSDTIDDSKVMEMIRSTMTKQLELIRTVAPKNLSKRYECMCKRVETRMHVIEEIEPLQVLCDSLDEILSDVFSYVENTDTLEKYIAK